MKDRVIGIENEYGVIDDEVGECEPAVIEMALDKAAPELGFRIYKKLWLKNGGCLYLDLRKLEYASPECRRLADVVAYNKAGERLARDVAALKDCYVFKTTVAPKMSDTSQ